MSKNATGSGGGSGSGGSSGKSGSGSSGDRSGSGNRSASRSLPMRQSERLMSRCGDPQKRAQQQALAIATSRQALARVDAVQRYRALFRFQ
jgi:hypothetical protein